MDLNKKLVRAVENENVKKVKELISQGADVNIGIEWASRKGHLDIVKYLIENGADVNADGGEALYKASTNGHLEVVKYLVENGADVNIGIEGASWFGHLDVVKYLVEHGADVTSNDNKAIRNASHFGYFEVVKYLHQNGGDLDKALENANPKIKEQLIEYKTNMEEKELLSNDLKEVKQEQKPKAVFKM